MLYHLPQTGFWNKSQASYNFTRFLQTVNLSQNLLIVESQFSSFVGLLIISFDMVTIQQKKQTKNQLNYYSFWFSVYPSQSHIQVLPDFVVCRSDILELLMSIVEKQSEIQIPNPVLVEVYLLKPFLMENNFMAKLNNS